MLTVGDQLPSFRLQSVVSTNPGMEFAEVSERDHPGMWRLLFFWPMDFTFVCPTEIAEFSRRESEFHQRECQILGASTDTHYVHLAWRRSDPTLKDVAFPMMADTKRELAGALGVLHKQEGVAVRATFLADPDGVIRWACANELNVGRSVDEVLRVLDALRTGELTPCNWRPGEKTLSGHPVRR